MKSTPNTTDDFYHIYPEIKAEAMVYAQKRMKDKIANFKSRDLANFIKETYTKLTGEVFKDGDFLFIINKYSHECGKSELRLN